MLNFTEHMKRIHHLADQANFNVLKGDNDRALDDLMKIGINCNEAVQQLDELIHTISQGTALTKGDKPINIKHHFKCAIRYLDDANNLVDRQDYEGARASVTKANEHTLEALDHVVKLEVLKADVELSVDEVQE